MTERDLDQLIRASLAPSDAVHAPDALGHDISRAISETKQRSAGIQAGPWRAPVRQAVWLVILASLLLLALALAVGTRPTPPDPLSVIAYHGGVDRAGTMPGPGPEGEVSVGWTVQRNGPIPFGLMPVARGDALFVADRAGDVSALRIADGQTLWSTRAATPISGSPVITGEILVVGTEGGAIVAYDTADGVERWHHDAGSAVLGSLSVADGTVIALTEDGMSIALDGETGEVVWTLSIGAATTRGPALALGTMYVPDASGTLTAVDLATRETTWSKDLGEGEVGTPAVSGDRVYAVNGINAEGPHALMALATQGGEELWSFQTDDGGQILVGAVTEQMVYAVGEDGIVYALDAASGAESWRAPTEGRIASLASVWGDTLYVSSTDGVVHALAARSGVELWQIEVGGEPTIPVVLGGRVFVGTSFGLVAAIVGTTMTPSP